MASKFSARSDMDRVLLGCEASRSTNERPDMYTRSTDPIQYQGNKRILMTAEYICRPTWEDPDDM
jgi:hypothetical protein